jgi:hypothetical protein
MHWVHRHEPVDEAEPAQGVEPVAAGPHRGEQDGGDLVGGKEPVLGQQVSDDVIAGFQPPGDGQQVIAWAAA